MKAESGVIDHLNALLSGELTAIDQYFIHSRMYENWGLSKLYERIHHEMEEEQVHADALIKRILFLEGTPDLGTRDALKVGSSVPEMLRNDLDVEYRVIEHLRRVIAFCEAARDFQTREILLGLLKDTEEDHAHWLETQLRLIDGVGIQNYLQSQL
jgi:bacterioferritin